jgi:mannose-1-phosphate guanylyltransferase
LIDADDEVDERYEGTSNRTINKEAARQSTHHARARLSPRLANRGPLEALRRRRRHHSKGSLTGPVVVGTKKVGVMEQFATEPPWAIVLAGGDGTRLQDLTRRIEGDPRPKQFSRIFGDRTLLGHTRERLRPVFNDDRLLFVVTKDHDQFYKRELADIDRSQLLEQPDNRGTAVAIIASLLQLLQHKPDAIVGIFPADHYYADEAAFASTVKSAIRISRAQLDSIILIGAKAQWPEVEYGWIEPGPAIATPCRATVFGVSRFCEKPPLLEARDLMRKGGLWNTFVAIGRAGAFLDLLAATVMPTMSRIAHAVAHRDLISAYGEIDSIDFSKDVLSHQPHSLLVMEDAASGWADLGHPERVINTLDRQRIQPAWLSEMRRTDQRRLKVPIQLPRQTTAGFPDLATAQ